MRYVSMQVLTWGTIGGAVVSALWLAAFDSQPAAFFVGEHSVERMPLPVAPAQAGPTRQPGSAALPRNAAPPTTNGNASAAQPSH